MPDFTYLAKPTAYLFETTERAYMVLQGKPERLKGMPRSQSRQVGSITSGHSRNCERSHNKGRKCGNSNNSKGSAKRQMKNNKMEKREDKVVFEQYGLQPTCNYDKRIEDENSCLRAENQCLQEYIRVLEERCNGRRERESSERKSKRERWQADPRKEYEQSKMYSTKETASWISHQM